MSQPLKFGVIGAGNIGNVHCEYIKANEQTIVTAITDAFPDAAKARAEEHGIETVCPDVDTLLEQDLDAVVIGVPNKYHADIAIKAMKAGKHVVLEKPMALNVEEAKAIVRTEQETGQIVMIPHQMRWIDPSRAIKQKADAGELGRVYYAKSGWMRRKGIPGWGTWFTKREESGGGPLIDIGVHMLDLALYLMGQPKPVSVYGSTYAEIGPRRKGIGSWGKPNWDGYYDVEDLAGALIKMDDGSTLSLEVSWAVNDVVEGGGSFIHLMGVNGGVAMQGNKAIYYSEHNDELLEETLQPEKQDARALMLQHFVECVQKNEKPISNVMTGLANNLVLDAIYRSSESGNEIKLDWNLK